MYNLKNIYCFGTSYTAGGGFEFNSLDKRDFLIDIYSKTNIPLEKNNFSYPGQLQYLLNDSIKVHDLGKNGYGNERMYRLIFDITTQPKFDKQSSLFLIEFSDLGRKEFYVREGGQHASFYSEEGESQSGAMLPRTRLRTSAAQNNVNFHVQAAANAITSPQMRFVQTNKQTGAVNYPNDETATAAINWGKEGLSGEAYVKHPDYYVPPEDKVPGPKGKLVKRKDDPRKYPNQGYPENFGRAADVTSAVRGGAKVKDVWKPTDADKVKPYYNAWVAPHEPEGNFLVSDTHTGAAGFAPHLANTPAETTYLAKKGVHAWHDHIIRQVLHDRGLTSVSRNQSAQWGQEKTEQGHAGDLAELTRGHLAGTQFKQVDGQQELF